MDIHDGTIIQWNNTGLYYWYGMGYGNCTEPTYWDCSPVVTGLPRSMCGFQPNHTINIYTSPDLINWTYVGDALPFNTRPFGIYFRPKVIYNKMTQKYVLWINWVSYEQHMDNISTVNYYNTSYIVATSNSPNGPFEIETLRADVLYSHSAGDFVIFIDETTPNNTAYIAYDAMSDDHKISIEPLTYDYLNSVPSENSGFISKRYHEAPALFERNGFYYLIVGHCCCFCKEGADAKVYISDKSPIGPYIDSNVDINFDENRVIIHAQQNYIAQIQDANGETQYIWTGDRWKSAEDGLKGHDFQYWQVLSFNDSVQPPVIHKLSWQETIQISIK